MSYTNTAAIRIRNEFPFPLKSITIIHQYSNDPKQEQTWINLPGGGITDSVFSAGYNTGFIRYGDDHWKLEVVFNDGIVWKTDGSITCTMHEKDDEKKGELIFSVGPRGFDIDLRSGNCQAQMQGSNGYNSLAFVRMMNKFCVKATITLKHQYSSDPAQSFTWGLEAETTSADYFIVYFNTGWLHPGLDYWNVSVVFDVPPYDNQAGQAFAPISNAKKDKECMLASDDVGKDLLFSVSPSEFKINIPSGTGACTDGWKTANGYNKIAFLTVQNDFPQMIRSLTLMHRYSDYTPYYQTRTMIAPGQSTTPLMFVEFNTGLFTLFDYWNITVVLADGTVYQNQKTDKECYLTDEDADKSPLTFKVSSDNFHIGLPSGPCNDGMKKSGQTNFNLGRDNSLRYDQNAYLASHNSFANFDQGFYYAQQAPSISDQMAQGVTTLLLDIWYVNNEVYLFHNYKDFPPRVLQPFGGYLTLADALVQVKDFLTKQQDELITLIFEDYVPVENRDQIKQIFINAGLWDQCFLADQSNQGWNVATQGWPTIDWMLQHNYRIVPFSSVSNPFPYQWAFMSETVYGDKSTDPNTWTDPRSQSQPLNNKALCAMNHFYDWDLRAISTWFGMISGLNTETLLTNHINDIFKKWDIYPNYIQVDFFEAYKGAPAAATIFLNSQLHRKPAEKSMAAFDFSKTGQRVTALLTYINNNLLTYPEPVKQLMQEEPYNNTAIGNISITVYIIHKHLLPSETAQQILSGILDKLNKYLLELDYRTNWTAFQQNLQTQEEGYSFLLPFALAKEMTPIKFPGYETLLTWLKNRHSIDRSANHSDDLLALTFTGTAGADQVFSSRLSANAQFIKNQPKLSASPSHLYALAHDIFYANRFDIVATLPENLAPTDLIPFAIFHLENQHVDLAAELILAYWLLGGQPNPNILALVSDLADHLGPAAIHNCDQSRDEACICCKPNQQYPAATKSYRDTFHTLLVGCAALSVSHARSGAPLN